MNTHTYYVCTLASTPLRSTSERLRREKRWRGSDHVVRVTRKHERIRVRRHGGWCTLCVCNTHVIHQSAHTHARTLNITYGHTHTFSCGTGFRSRLCDWAGLPSVRVVSPHGRFRKVLDSDRSRGVLSRRSFDPATQPTKSFSHRVSVCAVESRVRA